MARPRKQIDRAIVERLANRQCPTSEIAAVVGCAVNTLKRRFGRHLPLWREAGKEIIRSKQWEALEKGNTVMLIWLGKQYLGQRDKSEIDTTVTLLPDDPIAAYRANPALLDRALQLEKELADAATTTHHARPVVLPRLAVPQAPPSPGANGNGTAGKPGSSPLGS